MLERFHLEEVSQIDVDQAYAVYFTTSSPFTLEDADLFERLTGGKTIDQSTKFERIELEELLETEPLRYVAFCPSDGSQTPFYITDIDPDTCDGMTFTPYRNNDGSVNQVPVDLRETTSYILFADKQMDSPLAIDNPTERYVNYGELKEEFQRKLAEYVPADFSWESHIGLFEYAAYA